MKYFNIKAIVTCLLALPLMFACGDDDDTATPVEPQTEPKLEVLTDVHTFSFSSAGNTAQVLTFSSTRDWHIELEGDSASAGWATIFDRQGSAGDSIMVWIAAAENTDYDPRSLDFRLVSGDFIESFTIYQAQKDAVVITDPKAYQNLSSEEHVIPVEFALNTGDFDIELNAGSGTKQWITETEPPADKAATRAMIDHTVWFKVAENTTFNMRSGTITIKSKDKDEVKAQMNVFQYGLAKPVINVTNKESFSSLSSQAHSIGLNLSLENVASLDQLTIDIPSSDRDWLSFHRNEAGTQFVLNVAENTGGERSSTIAVCAVADHSVKSEVTVTQSAAEGVTVTISNKEALKATLSKQGGTLNVKYRSLADAMSAKVVGTNGESLDWIRIVNDKIAGSILLTYDANENLKNRSAVVEVFPVGNEAKADKITVTQAAGTLINVNGSLRQTLDALVADGVYKSINDISSLELKGRLCDEDWTLLKDMCTTGKGYSLQNIDLTEVTNTSLAANQFNGCTQLRSIVFPKAMRDNGERVCQNCTNLVSAKFNEGVTYVCNHFFNGCSKLSEVWLPSTIGYLYGSSFEKCSGLTKIHLQCKPLQILDVARSPSQPRNNSMVFMNIANNAQPKASTLYVPSRYVEYYKSQQPAPQDVENMHLANYLKGLTYDSKEWTMGTPAFDWKPGTNALRGDYIWSNASTRVVAEDSWETK